MFFQYDGEFQEFEFPRRHQDGEAKVGQVDEDRYD
jgi:hypothetical protein